jgi:hypothetical protein
MPTEKKKATVADHIRHLMNRMAGLERGLKSLETRMGQMAKPAAVSDPSDLSHLVGDPAGSFATPDKEVLAQVVELENRLKQLEDENKELSSLCSELREQHEAIANLYVAKHRLHASFDATEIMNIVTEILVELAGIEKFAILFLEKKKNLLRRVSGQGAPKSSETVKVGEGLLGKVAEEGKPFYVESGSEGSPPGSPLAIIPLKAEETTVGLIAVYKLLPHKTRFTPVDHQLLELVAEHAPQALLSARLHRMSHQRMA